MSLELRPPVNVLTRTGTFVKAYPLIESFTNSNIAPGRIFLDRNFHLVALTQDCSGVVGDCAYSTMTWNLAGSLAPYGVGLKQLLDAHQTLTSWGNRIPHTFDYTLEQSSGATTIRIAESSGLGVDATERGPFTFVDDQLLPSTPEFNVVTYTQGNPMPIADIVDYSVSPPPPKPWAGDLFPGENDDQFNTGFTHLELLQALRDNLSAAGHPWQTSWCIPYYQLNLPAPQAPLLPLSTTTGPTAIFSVNDGQQIHDYRVQSMTDGLGRKTYTISPDQSAAPDHTCKQLRESPWPRMPLSDFVSVANRSPAGGKPEVFMHQVSPPPGLSDRPTYMSWHTFTLHMDVNSSASGVSSTDLNYLMADPNTGLLESIRAPATKLAH